MSYLPDIWELSTSYMRDVCGLWSLFGEKKSDKVPTWGKIFGVEIWKSAPVPSTSILQTTISNLSFSCPHKATALTNVLLVKLSYHRVRRSTTAAAATTAAAVAGTRGISTA